jgi:acetyl-CoA carboxylase biotin carboxyl carrier protein
MRKIVATTELRQKPEGQAPFSRGSSLDVSALREVVELLERSTVTRLEWRKGDESLQIERGHAPSISPASVPVTGPWASPALPVAPAPAPAAASANASPPAEPPKADGSLTLVTSPFVGTFYRAPSPEAPAFVDMGQGVRKGQVLCIVEAMKLMNEIEAEVDGRILEVLVQNGHAVEFGQALFRIERAK